MRSMRMLWYMNSVPPACETCDPWPVKSTGSSACFACIAFLHLRQDSFLACGATRPVMRTEAIRDCRPPDSRPQHAQAVKIIGTRYWSMGRSAHQGASRSRALLASCWQSRIEHTFDDRYSQLATVRERQQRARGVDPHCRRARGNPARVLKGRSDCRFGACNCLFAGSAIDLDDRQGCCVLRHD